MLLSVISSLLADVAPAAGDAGAHNPFAVLTLIAAPAILTNASSVLALGTSNRFARAVDRQRQLSRLLETEGAGMDAEVMDVQRRQLRVAERRALLLISALTRFYTSLGAFAASALVSLVGAVTVPIGYRSVQLTFTSLALFAGVIGVGGLVFGCILLIRETRLTVQALREEARLTLRKTGGGSRHAENGDADVDDGADPARERNDDALR